MNEIYLSSEAPLVVFISSVICGMEADREAARQAVASTTLSRPWAFEFTPPSSLPLDESYLSYARTCDIFVLLAGERESDAVTRELRTAIKHRRPILAYVRKGERIPADIQRLIHRVKYYAYGSLDELRAMIVNGIHDEIIRNHRSFVRLQPNEGTERQGHAAVRVRDFSPVMAYLTVGPEHSAAEELLQKTATMFGAELGLRPKRLSPRARDTEEICYAS
ncbi:MAG: DUF4062 domain-containing protein, partial [Chloroflexi bacterium]|nr:DUF4062 domain-containing protein [Chloroflexota bacterium]